MPVFLLLVIFFAAGCSPFKPLKIESREQPDFYDELFPFHVEVCAVSRIRPLGGNKGSRAGHAVMRLQGACQDPEAEFPQIRLCPENAGSAEAGVGISVNKMFRNVNWVAVPDQDLFFHGGLGTNEVLVEEKRQRAIQKALALGVFKGVRIHDPYLKQKPPEQPLEEFIAQRAVGTDYALKFGRSILCLKIPITREMTERVVDHLNTLNRQYALGGSDYEWGLFSDNCTHTIYNALAEIHMMNPRLVRRGRVRQFFNLAVPANAVASLTNLASPDPLDDIRRIQKKKKLRAALLEYNWLPMRHGVVLSIIPEHKQNELYEIMAPDFETLILRSRTMKSKSKLLKQAFVDDRFTDLEKNLRWFEEQYRKSNDYCSAHPSPPKSSGPFYQVYCQYMREQLNDVREKLARMEKGS
jgi:hypothetical protein